MRDRLIRICEAFRYLSCAALATTRMSKPLPYPYHLTLLLLLLFSCGNITEDLVEAAAAGDSDALTALLSEGASPSAALIVAVRAGRAAAVQPLLDNGADPSSQDLDGRTALMWAVESGSLEIVNGLVEAGAAVNAEDTDGKTALALAGETGKTEIAQLLQIGLVVEAAAAGDSDALTALLSEGANPSAALIVAVRAGRAAAVQPLLDNGANPSSQDLDGRTALMWAVESGSLEIVNGLVVAGAAVNAEDTDGKTALALAEEAGKTEIAQLFRICRVGQELSPGDSCEVPGAGTFSVRADGCLGELPSVNGAGSFAIGLITGMGEGLVTRWENLRMANRILLDAFVENAGCIGGHIELAGFRASEKPGRASWRIDALP